MSTHQLAFTDSSLTDGQMAVWGGALDTSMMLAPAGGLSASGLAAIEILSPAVLDACLARGENPLQRLELRGGTTVSCRSEPPSTCSPGTDAPEPMSSAPR